MLLQETSSKDKFLNWYEFENSISYLEDEDLSKIRSFVTLVSEACKLQKKKNYLKIKLLIISSKDTASTLLIV